MILGYEKGGIMQVCSVTAANYNSNKFKQPSFEAHIDKSVETFLEAQVENGLANIKNQRGKLTKKEARRCEASLRDRWYQAYSALQKKASQMSDDIVISVSQTPVGKIFNTLSAKNTKTGKSTDLVLLVEFSGGKSHYVGKDKFKSIIENLDSNRINEKLNRTESRPRFHRYY